LLAEEDYSCAGFISGNIESIPDYTRDRWQFGVDMVYRCLQSKLLVVENFEKGYHDLDSFLLGLRSLSPFKPAGGFVWNAHFLDGTQLLRDVVKRHFRGASAALSDHRLNLKFSEEVSDIFDKNDAPLSRSPLLPLAEA
jgi:hypothetical protein